MSLTQTVRAQQPANLLAPGHRHSALAAFGVRAVLGSLFVALCSHIAVPLPFTPVPFTMQPFAVLLVGLLFGPSVGFSAMALYLAEGAAGLPVFTPVGLPGLARLVGPTGGYLFSYPLAAALAGLPTMLRKLSFRTGLASGLAALMLVYTCGALWFSHSLVVPFGPALAQAVAPFAITDALKVCAAAALAVGLRRVGIEA